MVSASTPSKPSAPVFISSTTTELTLMFVAPENLSGSQITSYKLFVDTLDNPQSDYQLIYQGALTTVTVDSLV
jgi:sRNA-binding regulator protein Hfq